MTPWFSRLVHDLKGPLSPLQTAVYLLKSNAVSPERQRELIDVIERQGRRLNRMLEEVGDWGRANQPPTSLRRAPCPIALVLDMAIGSVPGCAAEPVFLSGAETLEVPGDESRLVQLFTAVLDHATARDPAAAPRIEAEPAAGVVRVRVQDRGPTPDAAALAALFTTPQPQPADEGAGLRLLTAEALAHQHGGTLRAEPGTEGGLALVCELPVVDVAA